MPHGDECTQVSHRSHSVADADSNIHDDFPKK
jgi:hypothetical protein